MSTQDVVNLLTVANNELPSVEYRCEKLKREASLKAGNQNSARTLQELSYLISTTRNTLDQYELSCKQRRLEMDNTNKEYTMIKAFVKDFRDNNEEYVKIKQTVKREVESILTARRHLLKLAVLSIVGSLRKDSLKFYALYYNMSSSSAKSSSLPKTTSDVSQQHYNYIPFMNEQNLPIIDYSNEEICEKILLDESEELYDKIVEDLTNKTISDVASDSKSSLSLSLAHNELSCLQKSRMMRDM
jgi:hypothetical protein